MADGRVELVLLLETTPAALVLEARRCGLELARRVPEGPAARGAGGRAVDRFASAWAAHGCVDDPEVTVAHQVFILGTTLTTLFWNLNFAVIIFTVGFQLSALGGRMQRRHRPEARCTEINDLRMEAELGLGRIFAVYHRSSTLYHIQYQIRYFYY